MNHPLSKLEEEADALQREIDDRQHVYEELRACRDYTPHLLPTLLQVQRDEATTFEGDGDWRKALIIREEQERFIQEHGEPTDSATLAQTWRELWRQVAIELRIPDLVAWLDRKLERWT